MKYPLNKIIFCVFVFLQVKTFAQIENNEVKLIAHSTGIKILLRWAPTNASLWNFANENGYVLEKKLISRNGEMVTDSKPVKLLEKPIKPKPMMEWKLLTEKNDNAAIAAQALYGDSFDVQMNQTENSMISILNQVQVLDQKFSFALFSADQSFEVAKYSGLAFVDENIKENEKYLYTVRVLGMEDKVKSGIAFIGLSDSKKMPKPQDFIGIYKDKAVVLSWDKKILSSYYNSYIIERSEGNKDFKKLLVKPIVSFSNKKSNGMIYIDSLSVNNKKYSYRIKGISPFGIEGPYSDLVSGQGIKSLKYTSHISDIDLKGDNVIIKWVFPDSLVSSLSHFKLLKSTKPKGNYTDLVPRISRLKRSYKLKQTQSVLYYKLVSVGNDAKERISFPKLVQLDDITPPSAPENLIGVIDSTGVVSLNWSKNKESDLLGYRVFRSEREDMEFTQITFNVISSNTKRDTVNLKVLDKRIYYKIQAFDRRYNPSAYSKILKLNRPDIVPPTPPVFKNIIVNKDLVTLKWKVSLSDDAVSTLLYRKLKGAKLWELIKELPLPQNEYVNNSLSENTYLYTLTTKDRSGLESNPIEPVSVSISDITNNAIISSFRSEVNRESLYIKLLWRLNGDISNVNSIRLYKSTGDNKPTVYKILNNDVKSFIDKELIVNTKYEYLLQLVFNSGLKSKINKIKIKY